MTIVFGPYVINTDRVSKAIEFSQDKGGITSSGIAIHQQGYPSLVLSGPEAKVYRKLCEIQMEQDLGISAERVAAMLAEEIEHQNSAVETMKREFLARSQASKNDGVFPGQLG